MQRNLLSVSLSAGYGKQSVLENVQFELRAGERLGLIGSSGAGKSTLLLSLLGLLPWRGGWTQGEVLLDGVNLLAIPERETRKLRGKAVGFVPQSALTSLNSALSLRTHFVEAWRAHRKPKRELDGRLAHLFRRVDLPTDAEFLKRRPTQISIGQAQRITIALALLHQPKVLVADEPTSSLDPITQTEVIRLLRELSEEQGTALLYISHDLLSVLQLAQRVALLHDKTIVEQHPVNAIEQTANHPALRALLGTLPAPADVLLRYSRANSSGPDDNSLVSTLRSSPELYNLGAMACETISK